MITKAQSMNDESLHLDKQPQELSKPQPQPQQPQSHQQPQPTPQPIDAVALSIALDNLVRLRKQEKQQKLLRQQTANSTDHHPPENP